MAMLAAAPEGEEEAQGPPLDLRAFFQGNTPFPLRIPDPVSVQGLCRATERTYADACHVRQCIFYPASRHPPPYDTVDAPQYTHSDVHEYLCERGVEASRQRLRSTVARITRTLSPKLFARFLADPDNFYSKTYTSLMTCGLALYDADSTFLHSTLDALWTERTAAIHAIAQPIVCTLNTFQTLFTLADMGGRTARAASHPT